jgi:hypothetical protein
MNPTFSPPTEKNDVPVHSVSLILPALLHWDPFVPSWLFTGGLTFTLLLIGYTHLAPKQ